MTTQPEKTQAHDLLGDPITPALGEQADTTSALVEALESFVNEIIPTDPKDPLWEQARAALAAHRKETA